MVLVAVTFYFARHGETQFNVENRIQGWCDSPLTDAGICDARRLGRGLADVAFAGAYASDRSRAQRTLALALEAREDARRSLPELSAAGVSVPACCDERLREWCFGDLEGESSQRLRDRLFGLFGDHLSREEQNRRLNEIADYLHATDPTGRAEDFAAITARLDSFLDDCARAVEVRGGGNVLVVSHALLIRTLIFQYDRGCVAMPSNIGNASITKVRWEDGAITLEEAGATGHLDRAV